MGKENTLDYSKRSRILIRFYFLIVNFWQKKKKQIIPVIFNNFLKVCLNHLKLMGLQNFFLDTINTPLFLGDFDESQNLSNSKK